MKHKIGLQMKTTLLFFVFILLITLAVVLLTDHNNEEAIDEIYLQYAVDIGKLVSGRVTADEIQYYMDSGKKDERYGTIQKEIQQIQEKMNIQYLYIIYPVSRQEGIYIFDADRVEDGEIKVRGNDFGKRVNLLEEGFGEAEEVMESGLPSDSLILDRIEGTSRENSGPEDTDEYEMLVSVYVPIREDGKKPVAFVGVDMDIATIQKSVDAARNRMMAALLLLMTICFLILMLIIQSALLKPIHKLKQYAERISAGSFGETLPVRGHDELSEITEVFNRMSYSVQGHMEEIETINRAYQRYVPLELLNILNRDGITRLELGHTESRFVTILTFQLTEARKKIMNQDSRQVLENMNLLFQTIIPVITERNGFVERFQDAGMLAVYTDNVEDALLSAITICQRMKHNQATGKLSRISMGITYGGVLFGTVGHEKRMAAIAISPHASMAWYLQKLGPLYGSRLLIASGAAEQIPGFLHSYHYRFVGMTENKYTGNVEKIYDVYDGDPEEQRQGKERTREQFERGVELFCMRKFRESRQAFIGVLKRYQTDAGARHYLQYCNAYYQMEDTGDISIFM